MTKLKTTRLAMILMAGMVVLLLVQQGRDREKDKNLLEAARRGSFEEVQKWLDAGADVNARARGGISGATPLHEAAARGSTEMVINDRKRRADQTMMRGSLSEQIGF